jgi:small-conductance mechanosensitive channel
MKILRNRFFLSVLLSAAFLAATQPWTARAADPEKAPVTESDLARISDSELRALVLERLTPAPEAAEPFNPAIFAYRLQQSFGRVRESLGTILAAHVDLPVVFGTVWSSLTSGREGGGMGELVLIFAAAVIAGALIELLLRRRIGAAQSPGTSAPGLRDKLGFLLRRTLGTLLYVALFAGTAAAIFFTLYTGDVRDRTTFVFYLSAIAIIRVVAGLVRAYLGLDHADMRIPLFATAEAKRIYSSILVTVALGAFGFFTCALFGTLGVGGKAHSLLLLMVGTVMALGLSLTFLLNRRAFARDLSENPRGTALRRRYAVAYPWLMSIGTLLLWGGLVFVALLGKTPLFGVALLTIGLFIVWPGLDAAIAREGAKCIDLDDQITLAVLRVLRIGLAVAMVLILAILWRIDLFASPADGGLQAVVASSLLEIGGVVLIAYAAWQAIRIWIDRKITEDDAAHGGEAADASEMEIGGTGRSRLRTLLPLFKRALQATVGVIAFMIVLSSLGLDIGPILAGAGVVGLAIGFGSQTLVRDIVSGAFFLMDDAFRLGEYIDLGFVKGSVEKIAIRSLQLRHHRGALHTVPFGEIQRLSNYSRDWAIMKLRFRVPFDTDIEKARKVIKNVGLALLEHPDIGEDFIQPFKSQGVVEVDDHGLIISTKFMSKPGKQFLIRRHAFAAIQKALAENDIPFAHPQVRVLVSDEDEDEDADAGDREAAETETLAKAGAAAVSSIGRPEPRTS